MKKFYYTIGEVGRLLDLKQYVIRYWETEFHQLHPRKEKGRNRKYSEEDIELLKMIKDMLYNQKYTIDGARQKLKNQNKAKKMDQLEFTFHPETKPKEEQGSQNTDCREIINSIRARLSDFSSELQAFKKKWKLQTISKTDNTKD